VTPELRRWAVSIAVAVVAAASAACGGGRDAVSIGVLTDCEGGLNFLYSLTLTGAELPLLERGAKPLGDQPSDGVSEITVAGKKVRMVIGCTASSATSAVAEARRLVERERIDVLVGPELSETLAVKEYAATRPEVTFVSACCAAQSATLRDPLPNFFNFSLDQAQSGSGLGAYGYRLGWRRAVIVGPDEQYMWTYAAGIVAEFCALGGRIVKRVWTPTFGDPADVVKAVPKQGVDGIFYLESFGPRLLALLNGLPLLRNGLEGKVIGQSTAFTDFTQSLGKRLDGVVYSTGGTNSNPESAGGRYTDLLAKKFPKQFRLEGLVAPASYFGLTYRNAIEAVLQALDRVKGDLGGGQRAFRAALAHVELDAPNGHIRLDGDRQAITSNYLNRMRRNAKGELGIRTFLTVPEVDHTYGGLFTPASPPPGRTSPACKTAPPPPWARVIATPTST
jgi:branched-chain amino acid transport system substrate-binding protein